MAASLIEPKEPRIVQMKTSKKKADVLFKKVHLLWLKRFLSMLQRK